MLDLFNRDLLNQMASYGVEMDKVFFERKVLRVHRKCIRSGRVELAEKIFQKHSDCFKIKSDAAMAFYMSVLASRSK